MITKCHTVPEDGPFTRLICLPIAIFADNILDSVQLSSTMICIEHNLLASDLCLLFSIHQMVWMYTIWMFLYYVELLITLNYLAWYDVRTVNSSKFFLALSHWLDWAEICGIHRCSRRIHLNIVGSRSGYFIILLVLLVLHLHLLLVLADLALVFGPLGRSLLLFWAAKHVLLSYRVICLANFVSWLIWI